MPKPDGHELDRLMRRADINYQSWPDKQRLARLLGVSDETVRVWFARGQGVGILHSWVNIWSKLSHQQRRNHEVEMRAQRPKRTSGLTTV